VKKDERKQVGRLGEICAAQYLRSLDYSIADRNWKCRSGEIDLIAEENGTLIFIEVRTRTGRTTFGTPAESVDARKQRQVRATAQVYLHRTQAHERKIRFDVISIILDRDGTAAELRHIKNAF
jgi:putative endonuclease